MDRFGLELKPGEKEVHLRLSDPMVTVEGPWEMSFPASGAAVARLNH